MTLQPVEWVYPDADLEIITLLRPLLTARTEAYVQGFYLSRSTPNPRQARMVIIRRTSGLPSGTRDVARMNVNVWGPTEQEATDLATLVRALLYGLKGKGAVVAVPSVSGPADVADPAEQPQRFMLAEIHLRGKQLLWPSP